jgi:hypothetical protein
VHIVGRIPESTNGGSGESYDHEGWAKGHKKTRGKAPLQCKGSISVGESG